MRIGLVGYFGFGNYGDEMFLDLYRSEFPDAELTILRGCNGHDPHDPAEIERQDCIIVGGGDLVIAAAFSRRYWDPALLAKPVLIAGVGAITSEGESRAAVDQMAMFFQHDNVRMVSARDEPSRAWIVQALQPKVPVHVYPDLVAALPLARRPSERPVCGLVLRARHGTAPANTQRMVDRASALGYRTRNLVLGYGLTRREDLLEARRITTDEVVIRNDNTSITAAIAGCDLVASQRLHGCVVAMMMGIPTIGLRTTDKFTGWFGHFDPPPPLFDIGDPRLARVLDRPVPAVPPEQIARVRADARRGVAHLRRELARVPRRRRPAERNDGYYPDLFHGPEQRQARLAQRSPRLRADPAASLRLDRELRWYRREIVRWKGADYLQTIDDHISKTSELASLARRTKAIVTIPVAAVAEDETIHDTLSLYAQQGHEALAAATVLLFVNHADDACEDPAKRASVARTLGEIERARSNFPGLTIAAVVEPFDHRLPSAHSGIIGYVGRRMYDLAMMAVLRAVDSDRLPGERDVLLVRNDADSVGMSRRYLDRMIGAAATHLDADVFQGGIRWGSAQYEDFPGYGVAMGLKEGIRALTMRRGQPYARLPATNGSNVAVRMSSLAAVGGVGNSWYYGAGGDDIEIGLRINEARRPRVPGVGRSRPIRYVADAQIDASGERALGVYRSGKSVIHTWESFNAGPDGYTRRTAAGAGDPLAPDRDSPAVTLDRIGQAITDLVNHWYRDEVLAESALRLMIGKVDPLGRPVYRTEWKHGKLEIVFTNEGRAWLGRRLGQDAASRGEAYGARLRRRLYGDTGGAPPRMVSPVAATHS